MLENEMPFSYCLSYNCAVIAQKRNAYKEREDTNLIPLLNLQSCIGSFRATLLYRSYFKCLLPVSMGDGKVQCCAASGSGRIPFTLTTHFRLQSTPVTNDNKPNNNPYPFHGVIPTLFLGSLKDGWWGEG